MLFWKKSLDFFQEQKGTDLTTFFLKVRLFWNLLNNFELFEVELYQAI